MDNRLEQGDWIDSYFIGFEATGNPKIDAILVAIAKAGKAYHSTEGWNDDRWEGDGSYLEAIQQAANDAAYGEDKT